MKLISIDVGLRNLAVCVLEGTKRQDIRISHWEVIDVLGEKNGLQRPVCRQCKKPAMWRHPKDGALTCTRHCPSKERAVTKTFLTKRAVADLQTDIRNMGLHVVGTKKPDLVDALYRHYQSNAWQKLAGGANVKHAPVLDLAPDIVAALDRRAAIWRGADKVIFENQMDRRMLAVQAMLHMYFICRGYACSGISATHKLSNIVTTHDRVTTYRGRKKTGIVHAEVLCPPCNIAFFRSHAKQDDLADCFLQGLWWIEHS